MRRLGLVITAAVAVVLGALASTVAGVSAGTARAASTGWKVQPSPNPGSSTDPVLRSVAASSRTNAWAVGYSNKGTLIEHWGGNTWKVQRSPNRGDAGFSYLGGVAATSTTNAWAVGAYRIGTNNYKTLIEHWGGHAWKVQKSPNPGSYDTLNAVTATSSTNAWAVGSYYNGSTEQTLVEHWNGKEWKVEPTNPLHGSGCDSTLNAVTATSSTNAWAVGSCAQAPSYDLVNTTLIEHWNGKTWKVQPSRDPGSACCGDNELYGVAAVSSSVAWAVGTWSGENMHLYRSLIEPWKGNSWKKEPSPTGAPHSLNGVAATSSTNAWAVGSDVIEHWNGKQWTVQPSSNIAFLSGVAATSRTNAWAVGSSTKGTLIEHWNGK